MKTTSNNSEKTVSRYTSEKEKLLAINSLKLSGRAGKVTTGKNAGVYNVVNNNSGTSILTRFIFNLSAKKGDKSVTADIFGSKLSETLKKPEILKTIPFPPNYANLKTVSNRLLSEIRNGFILSFKLAE